MKIRKAQFNDIFLDDNATIPKYKRIATYILKEIEQGHFSENDQLMSITEFSIEYLISRDTVEKAYKFLKSQNAIQSVHGKGYFVKSKDEHILKVLFILDTLDSYKKNIFNAMIGNLGGETKVDLQMHQNSLLAFENIINNNNGKYDFYVVMPHFIGFQDNVLSVLEKLPTSKVLILDKALPNYNAVYQNFRDGLSAVFEDVFFKIKAYNNIFFVFSDNGQFPADLMIGFLKFCTVNQLNYKVFTNIETAIANIKDKVLFAVVDEFHLTDLIKYVKKEKLKFNTDIGVVSFNDTVLKDLLDISVVSSDYDQMGKMVAEFILNKKKILENIPLFYIDRESV